jgi:NAD(P)-dependent dehydrogenase (short-subunit alcohol dehydrogenase family)
MLSYSTKEKQKEWITGTPLNRLATVDEIANVVVFLASAESSYITGANLNVNGGMLMG